MAPGKHIDIAGQRFGRLVATKLAGRAKNRDCLWLCRCDCGEERAFNVGNLRGGRSKSCGCLQRELTANRNTTHGLRWTPEYIVWRGMFSRCTNPNERAFHNYGGRGIVVCDRWYSFEAFWEDMGSRPSSDHSIDRIDVNGNYEPGNCRWATVKEQQRNKRNTVFVEVDGEKISLADACDRYGIRLSVAYAKISRGLSFEDILSKLAKPICPYCGESNGLRMKHDGGYSVFGWRVMDPEYSCEGCFTGTDTGPCFDDLPIVVQP